MLLRGFPTRIFISKIYPKHPDYFKRLLNLAKLLLILNKNALTTIRYSKVLINQFIIE